MDKTMPLSGSDIPVRENLRLFRQLPMLPFSYRARANFAARGLDPRLIPVYTNGMATADYKTFFLRNSKAGCTTIAKLIFELELGKAPETRVHRTRNGLPMGFRFWREFHEAVAKPETFRFTFVREPVARARSAFFDFFVDRKNPGLYKHDKPMQRRGYLPGGDIQRNFDVFVAYVEESMALRGLYCDSHFRPQHLNLGDGAITYDFIGKLENYEADVAHAFALMGRPDFITARQKAEKANRQATKIELVITPQARKRLEQIYARDYELYYPS